MKNLNSKPVNTNSKITGKLISMIFYSFSFFLLPMFWILVEHWAFKAIIILCGIVCFLNVIINIIEIRRIKRLQKKNRRVKTVAEDEDDVTGYQRNI